MALTLTAASLRSKRLQRLTGAADALLAQTAEIVSLDLFDSADVMLMLIIGGVGYLYGGLIGAATFIALRDVISAATPELQRGSAPPARLCVTEVMIVACPDANLSAAETKERHWAFVASALTAGRTECEGDAPTRLARQ